MAIIKNTKQYSIFNIIKALGSLDKTSISIADANDYSTIYIANLNQYVPDFKLVWCNAHQRYRVYIHVANTTSCKKEHVGYTICVISGVLTAAGFVGVYQFLLKNRGNNKE